MNRSKSLICSLGWFLNSLRKLKKVKMMKNQIKNETETLIIYLIIFSKGSELYI